jgi:hypothetical protein
MIVTYCDCPHAMAEEAARYLRAAGYDNVFVLDEGFGFWKDRKYPVTVAPKKASQFRRILLRGTATGLQPGTRVYAHHRDSDQWEAGAVAADGRFELHVPLYGLSGDIELDVMAGDRRSQIRIGAYESQVQVRLN